MNLFDNRPVLQAVRDFYNLTVAQASTVLVAYQHGTVSMLTMRKVTGYDAKSLAGSATVSAPVRMGVLIEIGKTRVTKGSRPCSVYRLARPDLLDAVIKQANDDAEEMFKLIDSYEDSAKAGTNTQPAEVVQSDESL
jgi:hypothetical protein